MVFRFSRDRGGEHPAEPVKGWQGLLQGEEGQQTVRGTVCPTNACAGDNQLYRGDRKPCPVLPALCWSHARRKFLELADVEGTIGKGKDAKEISPTAVEAVKRIDAIFAIERELNGQDPADRLAA